ncbi:MAG: ECF transporter S component [Clostridia bacterium]|nr:ECF transporter S component [Clostridia bacterium]
MSQSKRNSNAMFNLTRCGLLSAMAVILFYIEIPVVAFYKLDLSTLPAILAGFAMGPLQGIAVIIVKNLVHMLGTSTAGVGELADILMSCAFVIPASLYYRRHKDRKSALVAMLIGSVTMIVAAVLVNYFILIPAYQVLMNLPLEVIIGMGQKVFGFIDTTVELVLAITAPFNILKAAVLSVVTYLLYKRVSPLLHQKGGR